MKQTGVTCFLYFAPSQPEMVFWSAKHQQLTSKNITNHPQRVTASITTDTATASTMAAACQLPTAPQPLLAFDHMFTQQTVTPIEGSPLQHCRVSGTEGIMNNCEAENDSRHTCRLKATFRVSNSYPTSQPPNPALQQPKCHPE